MRTTIQLPGGLFEEARKLARREGTLLEALVGQGLRQVKAERNRGRRFRLRNATFEGGALQPHLAGASWERIRELGYQGRGG